MIQITWNYFIKRKEILNKIDFSKNNFSRSIWNNRKNNFQKKSYFYNNIQKKFIINTVNMNYIKIWGKNNIFFLNNNLYFQV